MGIILLPSDFPQIDHKTASIIATELNALIEKTLKDPNEPHKNNEALLTLKNDMIASPQLYLKESTIKQLELEPLLNSQQ